MDVFFNPTRCSPLALGYLLGSIPFGYLLTRAAGLGDVRNVGSGNIGATNVLRTGHKGLAALTLLLDALKGTAAVLIGHWIGAPGGVAILASLLAGLAAFLGHVFPVWLGFRGGKGVATYIGVLLGVDWRAAVGFCAVWLLVAALTRYSSLSALIAALITPIGLFALRRPRRRRCSRPSCRRSSSTSTAPTSAVSPPERSRGSVPRRDPRPAAAGCIALTDAERIAALRLAPLRERRSRHLPRPAEALRQRRSRARRSPELSRRGGFRPPHPHLPAR